MHEGWTSRVTAVVKLRRMTDLRISNLQNFIYRLMISPTCNDGSDSTSRPHNHTPSPASPASSLGASVFIQRHMTRHMTWWCCHSVIMSPGLSGSCQLSFFHSSVLILISTSQSYHIYQLRLTCNPELLQLTPATLSDPLVSLPCSLILPLCL